MSNYIRCKAKGATYFFTAHLADRSSTLLIDRVDLLRSVMRLTMQNHPFSIDSIVVLPACIHTIWTMPTGDADYSKRWSYLKSNFSRALPASQTRTAAQVSRKEKGIWQRRFWEHRIRDVQDLARHRNLIHTAPVQSGLVAAPTDWAWTSLHRDLGNAHRDANAEAPQRLSTLKFKVTKPAA